MLENSYTLHSKGEMSGPANRLYIDGDYARRHPGWHLADAPAKANDLQLGLTELLQRLPERQLRLADVGAGVGGVLNEVVKAVGKLDSGVRIDPVGFDISHYAIEEAQLLFPELPMRCKVLEPSDGPFDAILLVDVLEHVENPWELLRTARAASRFLLIRQPLIESVSTFRHDNYSFQRTQWGHIGYFNHRSLLDMTAATGWIPLKTALLAPWELATSARRGGIAQRLLCRMNRTIASQVLSGFYLNGLFGHR
jgi:hypothetical protein